MQTALLEMPVSADRLWLKAALRECIEYGEHGVEVDQDEDGHPVCFNCGNAL